MSRDFEPVMVFDDPMEGSAFYALDRVCPICEADVEAWCDVLEGANLKLGIVHMKRVGEL